MKQINMWILTREENEYDQYGEYFVAAWNIKPRIQELKKLENSLGNNTKYLEHILKGGGRIEWEGTWFNLHEYVEGSQF